ncbi:MAG: hypothetical protein EOP10_30615, partial [Proteobacteria bacterium]
MQDGVYVGAGSSVTTTSGTAETANVAGATAALTAKKGGKVELQLYQKVSVGDGSGASNPWLQELPDPVTRAT